jgi:hypothetical protein
VKAAEQKQQLQQLAGIIETKEESVAKAKKAQPKYALDPKLPKVRVCAVVVVVVIVRMI